MKNEKGKERTKIEKIMLAHELRDAGFSMRKIAEKMGYNSPGAIDHLLKHSRHIAEIESLKVMIATLKAENKVLKRKVDLIKFYIEEN